MYQPYSPAVLHARQTATQKYGQNYKSSHLLREMLIPDSQLWTRFESVALDCESLCSALDELPCEALQDGEVILSAALHLKPGRESERITTEVVLETILQEDDFLREWFRQKGLEQDQFFPTTEELPPIRMDDPIEEAIGLALDTDAPLFRLFDATTNRIRESLRVIEDYCRFVKEDVWLTTELKTIRHSLQNAVSGLSPERWIFYRDTVNDLGTTLTTDTEYLRYSQWDVAIANVKRLQEALRSLEENAKILSSASAKKIEQIRYQVYTLEKRLNPQSSRQQRLQNSTVYVLITVKNCLASLEWTVEQAALGGASIFQLREKDIHDKELLPLAKRMREVTRKTDSLFIVNDRVDIALLTEADGVHLGQDDLPYYQARKILGPEFLIGVSTHDQDQLKDAIGQGADYVGVGPVFPSNTKNFDEHVGLELIEHAVNHSQVPFFAIGGIHPANIDRVHKAGAQRVAVSHCVIHAEEPADVTRKLYHALRT